MFAKKIALTTLVVAVASASAFAQTASTTAIPRKANGSASSSPSVTAPAAANTSTVTVATPSNDSILSRVKLGLEVDYFGQAINDLGSGYKPNADTGKRDLGAPISTDNIVALGYKLGGGYTAGIASAMTWTPENKRTVLLDTSLKVSNPAIYDKGGLKLGSELRLYVPTSIASHNKDMKANFRFYQYAKYAIPASRFTLVWTSYLRPYFYGDENVAAGGNKFRVYAGPEIDYQITPTLTAWVLFEYIGTSIKGADTNALQLSSDFEPGLSWDVTPKLSFSPYLDFKTSNRFAADTTTINAILTYSVL